MENYTHVLKKRGDVTRVLELFVAFGASDILIEAHPHIGTNKLPQIIQDIREKIIECGGQVLFETRLTDILVKTMRYRVLLRIQEKQFCQ
jgi:uncharacterized FAD-dependent dehydrogenase